MVRGVANTEHLAGVTVEAILDDRDIDIDDVSIAQDLAVTGDSVADHVIDGGADRFGEAIVVEGSRDSVLRVHDILVANSIQLASANARNNVGLDHFEYLGRQSACNSHFLDFFSRLDMYGHSVSGLVLDLMSDPVVALGTLCLCPAPKGEYCKAGQGPSHRAKGRISGP